MMDMQTALRDEVAERAVREHLVMDDRGNQTKHAECDEEAHQCVECHSSTQIERAVMRQNSTALMTPGPSHRRNVCEGYATVLIQFGL